MTIRRLTYLFTLILLLPGMWQNAAAQQWKERGPLPRPLFGLSAVAAEGNLYAVGGMDGQGIVSDRLLRYDVDRDRWEDDLPAMEKRRYYAAAVLLDGRIYVMGGRDETGDVLDSVEAFDLGTRTWAAVGSLEHERYGHSAVALEGRLFVLGGTGENETNFETVEVYDQETDEWNIFEGWRLGQPRAALSTVAVGGAAYSFGGFGIVPLAEVQRFDFDTGTETLDFSGLFEARGGLSAVAIRDSIYLMGGRNSRGVLDDVVLFVPSNDVMERWQPAPRMLHARASFGAAEMNGTIYAVGGFSLGARGERPHDSVESLSPQAVVGREDDYVSSIFGLEQNHPNPFTKATVIPFNVSGDPFAPVRLEIYDLRGRLITRLVDAPLSPGHHEVAWNDEVRGPASGVYFYVLRQGGAQETKMMTRIR